MEANGHFFLLTLPPYLTLTLSFNKKKANIVFLAPSPKKGLKEVISFMGRRRGSSNKNKLKTDETGSSLGVYLSDGENLGINSYLAFDLNFKKLPLVGIDEVGRGPLAGPLVVAAVLLPTGRDFPGVMDSKKLTHEERISLDATIKQHCIGWSIVFKSPQDVDNLNPLQATLQAMTEAYESLKLKCSKELEEGGTVLVDGTISPPINAQVVPVKKGDGKSLSIAAASIIAKVARDAHMLEEHLKYPQYGFDRHKGYGTKEHVLAIHHYGPSPIHRLTYRSVKNDSVNPNPLGTLF
jgi:ribonuclease HII